MGFGRAGSFRALTSDSKKLREEVQRAQQAQGQVAKDTKNLNAGANKSVIDVINAYDRLEQQIGQVMADQGTAKQLDDITASLTTLNEALKVLQTQTGEGIDWESF